MRHAYSFYKSRMNIIYEYKVNSMYAKPVNNIYGCSSTV